MGRGKNRDITEFSINYYRQIFARTETHGKIALPPFWGVKIGTVPIKYRQLTGIKQSFGNV